VPFGKTISRAMLKLKLDENDRLGFFLKIIIEKSVRYEFVFKNRRTRTDWFHFVFMVNYVRSKIELSFWGKAYVMGSPITTWRFLVCIVL